jgi:acid stress-induced BolA-like protein IbaG/YrbA
VLRAYGVVSCRLVLSCVVNGAHRDINDEGYRLCATNEAGVNAVSIEIIARHQSRHSTLVVSPAVAKASLARIIRLKPSVCHGAVLYLLISRNIGGRAIAVFPELIVQWVEMSDARLDGKYSMQDDVKSRVETAIPGAQVTVEIEGNRAAIAVISEHFDGMSRVKKQQEVYACIQDLIASGALHAVSIKAETP